MIDAPKQDWAFYLSRCRDEHLRWLRGLTLSESLDLFRDLHSFAGSRAIDGEERERLETRRLREKIELRTHLRAAFEALDRLADGRSGPANHR